MTIELSYNSNFMRVQDNVVSYGYKKLIDRKRDRYDPV